MAKIDVAHAGKMVLRLQGRVGREGDVTRRLKVSPHHSAGASDTLCAISLISIQNPCLRLLKMYKDRRLACLIGELETPSAFGKDRSCN